MGNETYNPLDKLRLGESVAKALLARPVSVLPPSETFVGAGIYALYYTGPFAPYRRIKEKNAGDRWDAPIYVGKAVPPGARKGDYGLGESPGEVLYRRLREHSESIEQAENLSLSDFRCRYLIVDDIWIPLILMSSVNAIGKKPCTVSVEQTTGTEFLSCFPALPSW